MSDKPFSEQAVFLIDGTMDLIKTILVKHSGAVLKEMHDQIVSRNERIALLITENATIFELNQAQFLELEYLRPIVKAAENLLYESEEYDFDDGLGKGAAQSHWDALASTLEPATDAIEEMLNASPLWTHRRNGGDSDSDVKPPADIPKYWGKP